MPRFKVTHNVKPKRTEEADCESFQQLNSWIDKTFNIEIKNIKFQKPRIKDQASFQKQIKEGVQITILGLPRKQKTEDDLQKEKKQQEKIQSLKEEMKLNPHEKIITQLKQKGIKERGIDFFNTETGKPEDLGIQYALMPLHLLKMVPEFRKYCLHYQVMQKNPDGLIIEELGAIFKDMEKEDGVVCPLEWISAWITYCADDIEFPYPTYDIDYFLNKTFATIRSAFEVELQKREQEPNSRLDIATKNFGLQVLTKRTDITKLDQDDPEPEKEVDKKVTKFVLECDLSTPTFDTLTKGIRERFKEKELWRNFYAFDIQYKEKIMAIERLPPYVMIHVQRHGYCKAKEESERVDLSVEKKSYHRVRVNKIIDLFDFCDINLRDKLELGRYERHQTFFEYEMEEGYMEFKKKIKNIHEMSDEEVKYQYLDHKLYSRNIFHEFFFETMKGAKPTGEYRIVGAVLHKGDYYHHEEENHNHDCQGEFQVIYYKRQKQWVRIRKAEVEYIDVDEALSEEYWGKEGQWTPVLLMYREIKIKHVQLDHPNGKEARKKAKRQEVKQMEEPMIEK